MSSPPPPRATPAPPQSADGATPAPPPRVVHKPRRLPGDRGPAPLFTLAWSSFFGSGYFPVAPGTAGTAAAIPLWWLLRLDSVPLWAYFAATVAITLTGIAAAQRAGRYYGVADSGHIVIDEVAGYLVTMALLPRDAFAALAGFFFFRACDVLKPWPARFFDRDPRWKNGAGVVLDDVFAGVWACALTWGAVVLKGRFFPG
ncbi:MAG TPA: phosphatidylglycerophosphatase A [Myxococcales bacterium]|nr:phosphatidylglycerophosphatase A [Myxococcales bacterium]